MKFRRIDRVVESELSFGLMDGSLGFGGFERDGGMERKWKEEAEMTDYMWI